MRWQLWFLVLATMEFVVSVVQSGRCDHGSD
jgi:hypothetical protein